MPNRIPQFVTASISGPAGSQMYRLEVDTGSSHLLIPTWDAAKLGIRPLTTETIYIAKGRLQVGLGQATVEIPGGPVAEVPVYLAPSARYLLGRSALEALGYELVGPPAEVSTGPPVMGRVMQASARYSVCQGCDRAQSLPLLGIRCRECGCLMAAKTRLPNATCPIGRW